jgi:hypothetical protein
MRTKPKTLKEYIVELQTMELQTKAAVDEVDIGALIDAWRLRYGTTWVGVDELRADPFYAATAQRLNKASHLEAHIVIDHNNLRFRLVERW